MDCSPPGSSVHGVLQARILEWVAISLFLLQGIIPTQRLNPGLLHFRQILYCLSHKAINWTTSYIIISKRKISSAYWTGCIFQRKYERPIPYWQVILTLVASLKWTKLQLRIIKGITWDYNTSFLHRPQKYTRDQLHKKLMEKGKDVITKWGQVGIHGFG